MCVVGRTTDNQQLDRTPSQSAPTAPGCHATGACDQRGPLCSTNAKCNNEVCLHGVFSSIAVKVKIYNMASDSQSDSLETTSTALEDSLNISIENLSYTVRCGFLGRGERTFTFFVYKPRLN